MSVLDYVMGQRSVDTSSGGGGSAGGLVVTWDAQARKTVQTWTEIKAALDAGQTVYFDSGPDLLAFAYAVSYHSEDVANIGVYFGNNMLVIDSETDKLYYAD